MTELKKALNFLINDIELTDLNEEILELCKTKNKDTLTFNGKEVKYELINSKIKINYLEMDYEIESNPYKFYFEEKNKSSLVGKAYTQKILTKFFKQSLKKYDLYIDKDIIKDVDYIIKNNKYDIIIKRKDDNEKLSKFNDLNKKIEFNLNENSHIYENIQELSPIPSKEFNFINVNKKFELFIEQRKELIQLINDFMIEDIEQELVSLWL